MIILDKYLIVLNRWVIWHFGQMNKRSNPTISLSANTFHNETQSSSTPFDSSFPIQYPSSVFSNHTEQRRYGTRHQKATDQRMYWR